MARQANRLTVREVNAIKEPGRYADGNGLYLKVAPGGSKSWVFMMTRNGQRQELGLGSLKDLSLAEARLKAASFRQDVKAGIDPRKGRKKVPTFGEVAETYIKRNEPSWSNDKHRKQWPSTLSVKRDPSGKWVEGGHCRLLRDCPVDEIDTSLVMEVLEAIWHTNSETGSRVRQRIEAVLASAIVAGLRTGPNPALWNGHLDQMLPAPNKLSRGHHPAMPYGDLPAFIRKLHLIRGTGAFALEFLILTGARSGEVRKARWTEIDQNKQTWIVPAERMKAKRIHRVPLQHRAMEILQTLSLFKVEETDLIFPGSKQGKPLSDMTLTNLVRRHVSGPCTVHGFRSTFRDWVGEETDYPSELGEAALSHAAGNETVQAYRRGDALERRRAMMEDWEKFCLGGNREQVVAV